MSYGFYLPRPGLSNVGSYQISGQPWLSGSYIDATATNNGEVCFEFPSVCRSFTVTNHGNIPLIVHFDTRANAAVFNHYHYSLLPSMGDGWTYAVKATRVYVSAEGAVGTGRCQIAAELTAVEKKELGILSGSGIND
jgi:hypothetical protein